MSSHNVPLRGAIAAGPGSAPLNAAGTSLVIREWTEPGPSYLHIHRADDEAWHVLEGSLRFRFVDGTIDAGVGTTVFVPAGLAHTYCTLEPSLPDLPNAEAGSAYRQAARTAGLVAIARHLGGVRHRAPGIGRLVNRPCTVETMSGHVAAPIPTAQGYS